MVSTDRCGRTGLGEQARMELKIMFGIYPHYFINGAILFVNQRTRPLLHEKFRF
nr:MAG TPA: hypothetical protein [Caudoviricetes sp.]